MNKGRYRLVYSDEHGSYVPVPEETSARSKGQGGRALRRLVAAMAAALPGLAIANPTGHQVMQGQVGIQQQGSTLNITASDKAIIISTHILEEVDAVCTRAVIIDKGRIVADGTPAELLAKSPTKRLDEVFRALTTPDADIKAEAMP